MRNDIDGVMQFVVLHVVKVCLCICGCMCFNINCLQICNNYAYLLVYKVLINSILGGLIEILFMSAYTCFLVLMM